MSQNMHPSITSVKDRIHQHQNTIELLHGYLYLPTLGFESYLFLSLTVSVSQSFTATLKAMVRAGLGRGAEVCLSEAGP